MKKLVVATLLAFSLAGCAKSETGETFDGSMNDHAKLADLIAERCG